MKIAMNDLLKKIKLNIPKNRVNGLLYNRIVLYVVFAIALANLYIISVNGEYAYLTVFILVGFLTTFFSKNMMVVLFSSIVITNLLKLGMSSRSFEGMETADTETKEPETKEPEINEPEINETGTKEPGTKDKKPVDKAELSEKPENSEEEVKKAKLKIMEDGKELLTVQKEIVKGFENIEPYMNKAESLATKIEQSAGFITNLQK